MEGKVPKRPGWRTRAAVVVAVLLLPWVVLRAIPLPAELTHPLPSTRVLAADRTVLFERLAEDGTRGRGLGLQDVSPHLVDATLASEDAHFRLHPGVDPVAMARALWLNIKAGRWAFGGSTITQQLARLSFPGARTLGQKVRESFWALVLEAHLSKDEILRLYLARAPYGGNIHGAHAAAESYFHTPLGNLSLGQASLLAVLPRSPVAYDLRRHLDRAFVRRDHILGLMEARGMVTSQEAAMARQEAVEIFPSTTRMVAPHAVVRVLEHAGEGDVTTTLQPALQERVEELVKGTVESLATRGVSQAAALVLEVPSGRVLAYVGSAGFWDEAAAGQVDGVTAPRSPGSALKPLVYAAALDRGYTAASTLEDISKPFPAQQGSYLPANFDGREHGPERLREALANSDNLAAVDLASRLGVEQVHGILRQFGLTLGQRSAEELGLGMVLGGVEATLWELATAYLALARGGSLVEPMLVDGESRRATPVVSHNAAYLITDILMDDVARSRTFGRNSVLAMPFEAAVKTGTSKDFRDNWTVGFSSRFLVATWAGNFSGASMHGVGGVSGAGSLWHKVMRTVHAAGDPPPFSRPKEIVEVQVCPVTGMRPTPACPASVAERFVAGSAPSHSCGLHGGGSILAEPLPAVTLITPRHGEFFRLDQDRPETGHGIKVSAQGPPGLPLTILVDSLEVARGQGFVQGVWNATKGTHDAEAVVGDARVSAVFRVE